MKGPLQKVGSEVTSTVEIQVDRSENHMLVDTVSKSLQVLLNAVGKANGRILFIDTVPGGI